jgi:putative heme-binding domain-containing protein
MREKVWKDGVAELLHGAGVAIGIRGNTNECRSFIAALADQGPDKQSACEQGYLGLTDGAGRLKNADTQKQVFEWLRAVVPSQREQALSPAQPPENRLRAIALLALEDIGMLKPVAAKLLAPVETDNIRLATIQLLRQKPDKEIARLLLDAWPTLTPLPREAAAQALASRTTWTEAFLTAVEKQQIKPSEVSPTIRASLQRLAIPALRDRAAKLFAPSGTRAEVLAKYQPALSLKGNPESGHTIYATVCAVCHRKGAEGRDIGPNLATVQSWAPEQILTNILDPNREVSPNFLLYAVELNDGRALAGLITSENAASIALKGADGIEQNVARNEVKSLKSTGMSLMPEGLEAALTPQQIADVMAFLRQ